MFLCKKVTLDSCDLNFLYFFFENFTIYKGHTMYLEGILKKNYIAA